MRTRLLAGTERRLGEAFTSVLLLAGCAGQMESKDQRSGQPTTTETEETAPPPLPPNTPQACPGISLTGISSPEPLDGLEIRSGTRDNTSSVLLTGSACSSEQCEGEVAALDARFEGWDQTVQVEYNSYVVGYRGGEVAGSATWEGELLALLGELDTPAEVQLLTTMSMMKCVRIESKGQFFEAAVSKMIETCPVTHQEFLYEVRFDATMRELSRGAKTETGACIGRKPEGLVVDRGSRANGSAVGDYLARAAELEAASVVAFLTLRAELEAHGAPPGLIRRVTSAARDEIRHAREVTGLAQRFGGVPRPRRIRIDGVRPLEAIAGENTREGCVTETWGALVGRHQAQTAADREVRRTYRDIARDELRHAALSWDLQAWLSAQLAPGARQRLRHQLEAQLNELGATLGANASRSPELQRELGLPAPAVERALFAALRERLWS